MRPGTTATSNAADLSTSDLAEHHTITDALCARAEAYLRMAKSKNQAVNPQAFADLTQAIMIKAINNQPNLYAVGLRAQIHYQSRNYTDALEDCNAVLEFYPYDASTLLCRAKIYGQTPIVDSDKLTRDIKTIETLDMTNPEHQQLMGGEAAISNCKMSAEQMRLAQASTQKSASVISPARAFRDRHNLFVETSAPTPPAFPDSYAHYQAMQPSFAQPPVMETRVLPSLQYNTAQLSRYSMTPSAKRVRDQITTRISQNNHTLFTLSGRSIAPHPSREASQSLKKIRH